MTKQRRKRTTAPELMKRVATEHHKLILQNPRMKYKQFKDRDKLIADILKVSVSTVKKARLGQGEPYKRYSDLIDPALVLKGKEKSDVVAADIDGVIKKIRARNRGISWRNLDKKLADYFSMNEGYIRTLRLAMGRHKNRKGTSIGKYSQPKSTSEKLERGRQVRTFLIKEANKGTEFGKAIKKAMRKFDISIKTVQNMQTGTCGYGEIVPTKRDKLSRDYYTSIKKIRMVEEPETIKRTMEKPKKTLTEEIKIVKKSKLEKLEDELEYITKNDMPESKKNLLIKMIKKDIKNARRRAQERAKKIKEKKGAMDNLRKMAGTTL